MNYNSFKLVLSLSIRSRSEGLAWGSTTTSCEQAGVRSSVFCAYLGIAPVEDVFSALILVFFSHGSVLPFYPPLPALYKNLMLCRQSFPQTITEYIFSFT
jgi:hypothetical protein